MQTNKEYVDTLTDKFKAEISSFSQQADNVCTQIQYNIATTDLLKADSYQEIEMSTITAINQQKTAISWLNDSIADIAFANNLIQWSNIFSKQNLITMLNQVPTQYGTHALGTYYSSFRSFSQKPYFTFAAPLYTDHEQIGTIFISYDLQKSSIQLSNSESSSSWFLLYDANEQITPINSSRDIAEEIFENCKEYIPKNNLADKQNFNYSFSTESYMIQIAYLNSVNGYIISAIDLSNTNSRLKDVYGFTWIIIIFCCIFEVLLGTILFFNFISPLNKFHHVITDIKEKRLRRLASPLHLSGCSEVREIGDEFVELLISIHDLNAKIVKTSNDLYETELQHKISELSFLKSQINPHFLYNTLELVRAISNEKNVPEVSNIAVSMAKILRYSIKGEEFVSLEKELEITQAYINIQIARFAGRISVIDSITEDARNTLVIKMLLQPLVENAIVYGLEPKEGNGILYISGYIETDKLIVTVRDNGVGITQEMLESLQQLLVADNYDTSKHIGLVNTNARIKLQYGADYGVRISSTLGDGTCVTLCLPAQIMYEGENYVSGSISR